MSNQRLPKSERREQLLEVAREAFAVNGFHGTSMNEIAEIAGVTKPVLYQHFESKRDLFLSVLTDIGRRVDEAVFNSTTRTGSPYEQVRAGFSGYLDFVESDRAGFRLLVSGFTQEDPEFNQRAREFETKMVQSIGALITIDGTTEQDRVALASGVVGLVVAMVRHWLKTPGSEFDRTQILDHMTNLAWTGLRR